jgi:sulfite reductase alpha subunit-like flavoprotein
MSMGKSVIAKLGEIASAHFGIEAKEGQDKVAELEKNKRVIKELWG